MIPDKVHFVGSIGLLSVEDVFHTCGTKLGRRLKRMPDGEVGGRRLWVSWQMPLLRSMPFLEVADPEKTGMFGTMRLRKGVKREDIFFGELGYAREARISYQDFLAARKRGDIAPGVRFQVSLPTPYEALCYFVELETFKQLEDPYEKAMFNEVKTICGAIPHRDLCIQWDVCMEMCIWDGQSDHWRWPLGGDGKKDIIERLVRCAEAVPDDVELGYHLCYGDLDAKHFIQPKDAGAMVDFANAISRAVTRKIAYIHMPVPIDRSDDAFFKPLDGLKLHPETELYLGVVHGEDGLDGLKKRIDAASKHVKDFGIATECGIARVRTPELVKSIIDIHAAGAREPAPH